MTTIRKIVTSKIDGNSADVNDTNEIRPFGEIAVYLNTEANPDKLTLMMFDGTRTHIRSQVLAPGRLYGSDADSGDGNGRDTIKLIPDASLSDYTGNDQYLIIDPTGGEPGHIHIRAGGTQDQSTADLYLGGELTAVRVSDTSGIVTVRTTNIGDPNITMDWSFQPDGNLYFPGIGNNRIGESEPGLVVSSDNSVVLQSNNAGVSNEWYFGTDGNLTIPGNINFANGVSILSGLGAGGTYGDADVQALLASNVSLIGSSSNITLATLGAGSTTTVSQEGGNPGINGQQTISAQLAYNPGMDLIQPGWTVTGNNITVTTTVTDVVETAPGFFDITTDTAEFQPFWYQDVYTFTSNTPSYSNITVSSGNIINAGTYGQINFVANSSGDGYGLSTIQLVPYTAGYDSAYIIIDPTYPNHIHIRAGGEQDNSPAQLFLGGENSYVSVDSGLDPNVYIRSNNNDWTFGTDGNLTLSKITPHGGINRGIVWDWGLGQAALGLGEGEGSNSYIRQTENGLEIHPNEPGAMGNGDLRIRTGNVSPGGTSYDWIFNGSGGLTFPTGGNVTFDASAVSVIDGITNINAVGTVGANVIQVLDSITSFGASPAPTISGFRSISTTGSAVNEGNISASGNLVASQSAYVSGTVFAAKVSTSTVITTPAAFGNLVAVSGARAFVNDANIVAAGNFGAAITGGGANTVPVWSDGVSWYIG